ncbi:bleomycin resistance protein [Actinoplanes sp. NPDC051513]|uniref:bleomycin resistance protein n=1 Tax=Actinoplanes sp. NPDC051513 TaxID=3363908 RepID=UPI0037B968CF
MTRPADVVEDADTRSCGCCGRSFPAQRVAELGVTPGVYICAGCAFWAARRAGLLSALRQIRVRALLPRFAGRAEAPYTAKAAIPILPSSDLDRTAAFYARAGFADAGRHDDYLLLHNDGVEIHFARKPAQDTFTPGTCFLHVADALKLWKQLRDQGVDGVGDVKDQDYGLREFVLIDPDGNHVRIGSPRRG